MRARTNVTKKIKNTFGPDDESRRARTQRKNCQEPSLWTPLNSTEAAVRYPEAWRTPNLHALCLAVDRRRARDHRAQGRCLPSDRIGRPALRRPRIARQPRRRARWRSHADRRRPPADEDHAYGHSKAEYFSSGVEGHAHPARGHEHRRRRRRRLLAPKPLEQIGIGLAVSVGASAGQSRGRAGVCFAPGSEQLDHPRGECPAPADRCLDLGGRRRRRRRRRRDGLAPPRSHVALLVAANIVWSGSRLVRRSMLGLMDTSLPAGELAAVRGARQPREGRYRVPRAADARVRGAAVRVVPRAGPRRVDGPSGTRAARGHRSRIREVVPNVTVLTHLESLDDPASWDDLHLDRTAPSGRHVRVAGNRPASAWETLNTSRIRTGSAGWSPTGTPPRRSRNPCRAPR